MTTPTGLPLSPDVLALNPHLSEAVAGARLPARARAPGRGEYKNELEAVAARDWLAVQCLWWAYEAVRLRHQGGWYTPDFVGVTQAMEIVFVEVKGNWAMKNARAGRIKLKAAAEAHPWARFIALSPRLSSRKGGRLTVFEWDVETIGRG